MEEAIRIEYVLMLVNGVLVGLVAFFMKQLVSKFAGMERSLADLATAIAVLDKTQEHHQDKLKLIDKADERFDTEIKGLRDRLHILGNSVNGLTLRQELAEEKCAHHLAANR